MTTYFITRHRGAVDWLHRHGVAVDCEIQHLANMDMLQPGDRIYGTLPVNLVADVCARGVRYWHLVLPQTLGERGSDRSAEQMESASATFVEYVAHAVPPADATRGTAP